MQVTSSPVAKAVATSQLEFLLQSAPEGPWVLSAIDPVTGAIANATFIAGDEQRMQQWIAARNGCYNLHFMPNLPATVGDKRYGKADIAEMRWVHVDLDPPTDESPADFQRRTVQRLMFHAQPGPPTVLIASGNGVQALW